MDFLMNFLAGADYYLVGFAKRKKDIFPQSLGYTVLRDPEANEVIVPNSVMMSSIVIRIGKTRTSPV